MKAAITNTFNVGDLSLTLETALFARKRAGQWRVHLNYHKLTAKWLAPDDDSFEPLIYGISIQTSRDSDWAAVVASTLGLIGIAVDTVKLVKQVIEALADVASLLPKVIQWISDEILKIAQEQEPSYRTKLEQAQFVINLFKDGAMIERRSPRWRMREKM
jgi:hypothetical protein